MPKRALTESSGHQLEKQRLKRNQALILYDADGMEPNEAILGKKGSKKYKNGHQFEKQRLTRNPALIMYDADGMEHNEATLEKGSKKYKNGDVLAMQNNISGDTNLNEGPSIIAEVVGQHAPPTQCSNDESPKKTARKAKQASVSEKMNYTKQEEHLFDYSLSSGITIDIIPKVFIPNFKGELSLPPSPITGVIDCLVDKSNPQKSHLDLHKEGEIAFSFQQPNKTFSKETPLDVVSLGIHGEKATHLKERTVFEDDLQLIKENRKEKETTYVPSEKSVACCSRKKLLVLDLNGLLCDIVNDYNSANKAEMKIGGKPIFKRPFCDDFLKFCFDNFHMAIWSSRRKYNVDTAVDYLLGDFKHKLLFCWDQSKCTHTGTRTIENYHKPLVLKELKKIWNKEEADLSWEMGEFSSSNTLLIDDSPYKALRNPPHTAIFPFPYHYSDKSDNSLGPGGDIRVYIEQLLISDDVQSYVEHHPFGQPAITATDQHWNFYCHIISSNATPLS